MIFSSVDFLIFLFVVWSIYFSLANYSFQLQKRFLVLASLFFYGYWSVIYLPIIVVSTLLNYCLGRLINLESNKRKKKVFLSIGVVLNILLLATFKYLDFFILNLNYLFSGDINLLYIALPLAISFFTFQQIAYLVDAYKNDFEDYQLADYFLFVTFFPQLIAGPIVHHKQMMPQFKLIDNRRVSFNNVHSGLFIFGIGLFKKIVIADYFGDFANLGYESIDSLTSWGAWSTTLSYTIQLYFDFSGYCDMAIGAALLFNINLPINFNSPYKAYSIQDFWRRWHITLSTWLRDYVYIPLGGNRGGESQVYRNLFITFLIGGFWHGAGWGFVIWGVLHGLALCLHRFWSKFNIKIPSFIAWCCTILFVHFAWVFFRADTVSDALVLIQKMSELSLSADYISQFMTSFYEVDIYRLNGPFVSVLAISVLFACKFLPNSNELLKLKNSFYASLLSAFALVLGVIFMAGTTSQTFLYFDF